MTAEQWRSHGYGRLLNDYLVERGEQRGLHQRPARLRHPPPRGHRFYFRERYAIWSFHFVRPLKGARRNDALANATGTKQRTLDGLSPDG